jgi:cytochrome b561
MNTPNSSYTRLAMLLHWLIAILMIGNIALIWTANYLPDDSVRPFIDTHKSIGITVLGLAVLRLLWRAANPPPPMPETYRPIEKRAAHAAHWVLYVLMFAMPLSGWAHDSAWSAASTHPMFLFGLFQWPRLSFLQGFDPKTQDWWHDTLGLVHTSLAYVLIALLVLHILGALKHQFIDKDREFQRMLPWG